MELNGTQEVILRLKEIKKENELTLPRIMDMIEANGEYISMTTLRRVFAPNSENEASFSYDRTLQPIARALLFQDAPGGKSSTEAEIEGLKAVIWLKNEEIAMLQEQGATIREQLERRVAFLLDQIAKKDARMDRKDEIISKLMTEKEELFQKLMERLP